jgi:hypothetical protein
MKDYSDEASSNLTVQDTEQEEGQIILAFSDWTCDQLLGVPVSHVCRNLGAFDLSRQHHTIVLCSSRQFSFSFTWIARSDPMHHAVRLQHASAKSCTTWVNVARLSKHQKIWGLLGVF